MIDIDLVRKETEQVMEALAKRGVDRKDVIRLLDLDELWRKLTTEVDELRAKQNEASREIGAAEAGDRDSIITQVRQLTEELKSTEMKLAEAATQRDAAWRIIPNMPEPDVPAGGEDDAEEIRRVPEQVTQGNGTLKSYLELLSGDEIDLERAAKVSGSRFVYLTGKLARLQLGLVSFAFDTLEAEGFIPVIPPVLVGTDAMRGMGYADKHADEIYKTQDDLYLVGTSEQSIGPRHMNEIFPAEQLPRRYAGYSTCFRRESGSHGKDVRGILRVHQFDKVEMFSITTAEASRTEHEFLLAQQEKLWQALELPYRVVKLAAGDLGAPSAKTYDIETWIPGEGRYRETHSTSNTTDFQARRLNVRVRYADGRIAKAHMLNGTAFAIGRTLIALIENHQQADGSIAIPEALHPYVPFKSIG